MRNIPVIDQTRAMKINQDRIRDMFFLLTLVNLFWVGMNCPDLSQGFFFLSFLILWALFCQTPEDRVPMAVLSVLWAYLILHYLALFYFGFIKPFQLIKEPLFLMAAYKYGHSLGRHRMKHWPGDILFILLAMVSGFVVFAFLSIYLAPNVSMYASQVVGGAKAGRTGIMIWTGEAGGFGPILGIQGNLGSAFLPILIFGGVFELIQSKKRQLIFLTVCSGLILAGFYTNVLLKNRGPFVIIAGLMGLVGLYCTLFGPSRLTPGRLTVRALGVLIIAGLVMVLGLGAALGTANGLPGLSDFSHLGLVSRFTQEGGSSPRTLFWENCIKIIAAHPLGGRKDYFGHEYAHNIWLDVGYDSGVFAMFFLIVFHGIHFKDMAALAFGRLPIHIGVVAAMIALFVIIFISLFTEPVGKGYTIYYAMTFFYCGVLKRLTADGLAHKKELIVHEIHYRLRHAGRLPS